MQGVNRRGLAVCLLGFDDVCYVVENERTEGDVRNVFVVTRRIVVASLGASVDRRTPSVGAFPVEGCAHVRATAATSQDACEDMNVLPNMYFPLFHAAAFVSLEQELNTVELFLRDDRLVVFFNSDPFRLIFLFMSLAVGVYVVQVRADIKYIGEYLVDASGGPRLSCPCRETSVVKVTRNMEHRLRLLVFVEDRLDYLDFFGMRRELFGFLVVGISVWNPSTVPLSVVRSR